MRFLLGIAIILSGLAIGCRRSEAPPLAMPAEADPTPFDVPDFAVWRPFFFTAAGDHSTSEIIGTAFAIRFAEQGEPVLLTAYHLLGPEAGLTMRIEPGTLREMVNQVVVSDAFGVSDSTQRVDQPIELAADGTAADDWIGLDMVVVPVGASAKRFHPLDVSDTLLEIGDSIWMSAAVFGGAPASQRAHRATVTSIDTESGAIEYRFENDRLSLRAADGAPLLDARGRVVGMHLRSDDMPQNAAADNGDTDSAAIGDPTIVKAIGVSIERLREGVALLISER